MYRIRSGVWVIPLARTTTLNQTPTYFMLGHIRALGYQCNERKTAREWYVQKYYQIIDDNDFVVCCFREESADTIFGFMIQQNLVVPIL